MAKPWLFFDWTTHSKYNITHIVFPSQPPIQNWTFNSTPLDCLIGQSQSKSQSYITTDGQSASLSWNKAPILDLRPYLYYCQTVAGLLMWSSLSDELPKWLSAVISLLSVCTIYILHVIKCVYNIYKASVGPGSVQQIMPINSSDHFAPYYLRKCL
jgi:hypothetical protein